MQRNSRTFLRSDGSLYIERTVPEDAGTYVCTAVNVAGTTNITVSLEVHGERADAALTLFIHIRDTVSSRMC